MAKAMVARCGLWDGLEKVRSAWVSYEGEVWWHGSRKYCNKLSVYKEFISIFHNLVGTTNKVHIMFV